MTLLYSPRSSRSRGYNLHLRVMKTTFGGDVRARVKLQCTEQLQEPISVLYERVMICPIREARG